MSNPYAPIEDDRIRMDLEVLASVTYAQPDFKPLTDFSLNTLIYHGNTSTVFTGHCCKKPAIIETCDRIPFRLVCREIKLLSEISGIESIVKVMACTRNPSLGVVALAYDNFDFQPWTEKIEIKELIPLFGSLLGVLSKLHYRHIIHNWICKSSVYVLRDKSGIILGSFHAAIKTGEPAPLTVGHSCYPDTPFSDPTRNDLYSAAMWFLSYATENPKEAVGNIDALTEIPGDIAAVLKGLIDENGLTADAASKLVQKYLGL